MKNILLTTLPHNVLPKCLSFIKVVLEFSHFTIFHQKIRLNIFGKVKFLNFLAGFEIMTYSFAVM